MSGATKYGTIGYRYDGIALTCFGFESQPQKFVVMNAQPLFGKVYLVKGENMKKLDCPGFCMVCHLEYVPVVWTSRN